MENAPENKLFYSNVNSKINKTLESKAAEQAEFLNNPKLSVLSFSFDIYNEEVKIIQAKKNDIYVFKDTHLVFWTNNDIDPDALRKFRQQGSFFIKNNLGYFLVSHKLDKDVDLYLVYKIYNHYVVNNEFFPNSFSADMNVSGSVFSENEMNVGDSTNFIEIKKLPNVSNEVYNQNIRSNWSMILYVISIVCFVFFSSLFAFKLKVFHFGNFVLAICFYVLILISLTFFDVIFQQKDDFLMFMPEVAAYSHWIPSLGHSILFSCGIILILLIIYQLINNRYRGYHKKKWHYFPVSIAVWLTFYTLLLNAFPSFVLNSQVSFDFTDLANVNYLTIISMTAIFQFFIIIVIYFRILSHTFNHQFEIKSFTIFHASLGVVFFTTLYFNDHFNGFLLICFYLLSVITCFWLLIPKSLKVKHVLYSAALFSTYLSVQFDQLNSEKEHEQRKIFANKFLAQEDFENELVLSNIEANLIKQDVFSEFYNYNKNDYSELELNYKYAFFSDYIKNYDIDFLRYDSMGNELTPNNFSFSTINSIYNNSTHKSISNYFLFIKDVNYLGGYLAKYEICPGKRTIGYVFIMLIPKIKSDLFNLDYFFNKKANSSVKNFQYSFAVYQNQELVKGLGSFPFKLRDNRPFNTMEDVSFFEQQNYSHLLKKIDERTFLIVSKQATNWQKKIGELTSVLLFFMGVLVLGYILLYLLVLLIRFVRKNSFFVKIYAAFVSHLRIVKINKLYLETKIRIAFLLMAVIICSLVSYFTVQNVNSSFNEKQNEELDKKMSQIVNEIEIGYQRKSERSMNTLIKHLAYSYEVDINLYTPDGKLDKTGNEKIYTEGWFAPLMNSNAYFELSKIKRYNFKQSESIGKLTYLSSYNALFDENRKLIGYVHLPYFAKSLDLKKEFSKYLGSLLNISTLLLLLSLVAATYVGKSLVKPLKIMISRISQIKVGTQNKPIEWYQNDEIGQLVHQYNLMLKKLELSTEKLAQSEREGAWKEMAKQVAHEIKNPLTPMKLHLQYLQMAINRKDEDLLEKISRVTDILIVQIDQLSKMAEEFSSFAQMPIAILEVSNISEILMSVIHLFKIQSGIEINYTIVQKNALAYIDKDQLQRVFTNILKNAQQAAKDDESCMIEVKQWVEDHQIHISFKDNGKGISDELKDKIFMPNFSTKTSGMGLGLSICRKIIENVNGSITFESELNTGTTFLIVLPLVNHS
ncbi:MAG: HAMP domain-containing sensor histidine kinase [bacterium]|nr:HAMP domain-containing sensor histidine kinase [bacterium]